MLARPAPVYLTKVRAHIGVAGNEAADTLARNAHEADDVPLSSFQDPLDRGPACVRAVGSEDMYDLDDLQQQALKVANTSFFTH